VRESANSGNQQLAIGMSGVETGRRGYGIAELNPRFLSANGGYMPENGLLQAASPYTVDETVNRLESILAERGVRMFALIDHSGEAAKIGMKMRPTKLVIFGSPKGGTPVMVAAPTLAIDLPLKALVWEDEGGKVWVSYNSPEYLQQRHGVPEDLIKNIAVAGALVAKAVE
jgi:uncharacterized protein (DUF302 family)